MTETNEVNNVYPNGWAEEYKRRLAQSIGLLETDGKGDDNE